MTHPYRFTGLTSRLAIGSFESLYTTVAGRPEMPQRSSGEAHLSLLC